MRVHTYTYWKIRKHLQASGMDIRNVTSYKGTRYGRPAQYMLYDTETGRDISVVTLCQLRAILHMYDIPIDE